MTNDERPVTAADRKVSAIDALKAARRAVLEAAVALSPEAAGIIFLGEWSAKDIVAHLIGWDRANAEAVQAVLAGRLPAFYAHRDPDWRAFNAELVAQYRDEDYVAGLRAARASHQALCELLESIPAAEFERDHGVRFRGYKVTIARLLAADSRDEQVHAQQLREFQRRR